MISFNIKQGLDFDKLNHNISTFKSTYEQEPIIIMSFDTLNSFPKTQDQDYFMEQSEKYNYHLAMMGTYHGNKVFADPSMDYGDIELR